MNSFELVTRRGERKVREIAGVGVLRRKSLFGHGAEISMANGDHLDISETGWLQRVTRAIDPGGDEVGASVKGWGRNLVVQWQGKEFLLKPTGVVRPKYELIFDTQTVLRLSIHGVRLQMRGEYGDDVDPRLVLFIAWVVTRAQEERSTNAGAAGAAGAG